MLKSKFKWKNYLQTRKGVNYNLYKIIRTEIRHETMKAKLMGISLDVD